MQNKICVYTGKLLAYNQPMRKLILFFIFIVFLQGAANAKSVEFSAVSNLSLEVDKSVKYADKMTPSIKNLLDVVEQINNNQSEFTIFLGDNLKGPDKYNLVMFAKIIRKLKKPVYALVGDKDVSQTKNLNKKEYYRVLNIFSKNRIKDYPYTKKINGFIFVFLDGVNQFIPTQYGYYKEDQTALLDEILNKYKNNPVIIVGHYPIFQSDEIKENMLPNNIGAMQEVILRHNNVIAIISGHHNIDDEYTKEDIYNISVQGLDKAGEYKKIYIDYNEKTKSTFVKTRIYGVDN